MQKANRLVLLFTENGYRQKGLLHSLRSVLDAAIMVSDEAEAIMQFEAPFQPQLILIDSSISNSDCVEILERTREHMPDSSCVVLVEGNPAFRTKSGTNFDGVIRKDVPIEVFLAEVEGYLSGTSAAKKTP